MKHEPSQSGLIRVRSMMPMNRRQFGMGAAGLGALAATGLGARPARAATDVTFLGWQGYDEGLFVDDFMAENEITLNTTYIGNNDEIVTRLASGGLGSIDIVTPYMGYIPLLAESGLIQPIDTSKVPNLANVMDLFRYDENIVVGDELYGVPFTWGSAPMMYNPAEMATPESWHDLMAADLAGKIGMMDDPLGNLMLAGIIATDAESATMLTYDQLTAATDFLIEVKAQSRLVAVSWGDLADALARGDIVATFSGWETIKKFAADLGAAIEYTYPKEGTFAWLDTFSIATDAPNADVDHMLCDKIISVEAQTVIGDDWLQGIVNTEAMAALDPDAKALYPYDDMDAFGSKAKFYAFPPLEEDGVHATFDDWIEDYERFKTA